MYKVIYCIYVFKIIIFRLHKFYEFHKLMDLSNLCIICYADNGYSSMLWNRKSCRVSRVITKSIWKHMILKFGFWFLEAFGSVKTTLVWVETTIVSVKITLLRVKITLVSVIFTRTRFKITLVWVETTLVIVKIILVRVKITLWV
jgi:hypothetical protein